MIDVNLSMIEPKLALFQVQVERVWVHATAFGEPSLGITPEPFNPVDMAAGSHKFSDSVINSQMLRVTQVDKAIVGAPSVAMDDAIQADFASNDALERISGHIRYNLGVDFSIALVDAKHDRFAPSTTSANTFGPPSSEVGLVDFDVSGKRRLVLAVFSDSSADGHKVGVDCVATQTGQFGDLGCVQIQAKELENLSEYSLRNS
jgi:hypothetical protein